MLTPETRSAVLGELVQDASEARLGTGYGLFVLGVGGYFDVDNAAWREFDEDDAPWDSEHFVLHGTVADMLRRSEATT